MGPKDKKSLYGIKQGIKNWFDTIRTGLERRGYHQYQVNPCVFYRKDPVILTYSDYCVIVSHKQEKIKSLIESLKNGPGDYVLTYEGYISNYLGVNIKKHQMRHLNHRNCTLRRELSTMSD